MRSPLATRTLVILGAPAAVALGCAILWVASRPPAPGSMPQPYVTPSPSPGAQALKPEPPPPIPEPSSPPRALPVTPTPDESTPIDTVGARPPARRAPQESLPTPAPVEDSAPADFDPVPLPVARAALVLVGMDPEAEETWCRAINDPLLSAHDRSDLIEDLNEEGFPDPKHVTIDDLPLILSRLAIIERLLPEAMDEVNDAAFREAYKDLYNMIVRRRVP